MALTQVSSKGIKDGTLLNEDVNASAAIAGSKIAPDFGSQNIVTTGNITVSSTTTLGGELNLMNGSTDAARIIDASIGTNDFLIRGCSGGDANHVTMISAKRAAEAALYYSGQKKLETTSAGIDVTGRVTTDELTVQKASGNLGVIIEADNGLGTIELGGSTGAFIDLKSPASDDFDLRIDNGGTINSVSSLHFTTNGSERMRIDSSGNVGIGTTSPTYKLHLTRTDAAGDYAYFGASSDGGQRGLEFSSSDTGIYLGAVHTINASSGGGVLAFATGSSERMRIDDNGVLRVGNTHDQTTSGNTKRIALGAKGSIWGWASGQVNGALTLADNYYWDGSNNKAIESDYSAYLSLRSGSMRFGCTAASQTGGNNISGGIHEKVRFENNGNVEIADGNLVVANGHGIDFSATSDGSGTSNVSELLSDFETGTFSLGGPVLGGGSFTTSVARYTRIGNVCHVFVSASSFSTSGQNFDLQLSGLPFTSSSTQTSMALVSTNKPGLSNGIKAQIFANNTTIAIRTQWADDGLKSQDFNGYGIDFNATYIVG